MAHRLIPTTHFLYQFSFCVNMLLQGILIFSNNLIEKEVADLYPILFIYGIVTRCKHNGRVVSLLF